MDDDLILSFSSIDEVIKDKLYIGDLGAARGIHRGRNPKEITHVLSVCPDYYSENSNHLTIPVDDSEFSDILIELPRACEFIDNAISGGGRVLVHCVMGISRSATTVCAYLMRKQGLNPEDALLRLEESRPQVCPNAGFRKQLVLFQRCGFNPRVDDPAYCEFKDQLKHHTIKFLNQFIDVYPYDEEKIFLCSDLPYSPQQTELLLDCYCISHLLTIRPAESTARDTNLPTATCLHIEMDDFEKDDLVLYSEHILNFIESGITRGTGVLIHSFEDSHIHFAFAAYIMYSRKATVQGAIDITVKVKENIGEENKEELQGFVEPRLQLLESCHFLIKEGDSWVEEFMKSRSRES